MNWNREVGDVLEPLPPDDRESETVSLFTCSQTSDPNASLKFFPAIVSFDSRNPAGFPFVLVGL